MKTLTQTITLNAGREHVWLFITKPENFPKYVHGYIQGKTTGPNAVGIGARYEWKGKWGPFTFQTTEAIIDWQDQNRVAYAGTIFGIAFHSSMNVKSIGRERTILTVSVTYDIPFSLVGRCADFLFLRRMINGSINKSLVALSEMLGPRL